MSRTRWVPRGAVAHAIPVVCTDRYSHDRRHLGWLTEYGATTGGLWQFKGKPFPGMFNKTVRMRCRVCRRDEPMSQERALRVYGTLTAAGKRQLDISLRSHCVQRNRARQFCGVNGRLSAPG
jgi:hypothetical protein